MDSLARQFVWLTPRDVGDFSEPAIAIVHSVIDSILPLSAKEASDLSHVEPWLSAYNGEHLPVAAAAVTWGEVDDDDMKWATAKVATLATVRAPSLRHAASD